MSDAHRKPCGRPFCEACYGPRPDMRESPIQIKDWGFVSAADIEADEPSAKLFRGEMDRRRYSAWLHDQKVVKR